MRQYLVAILFLLFVPTGYSQGLDLELYDQWHGQRNRELDGTANNFSATVYPVALAAPLAQCLYGLASKDFRHLEYGVQTTAGLIINTILTYGLKNTVNRERPYDTHPQYTPVEHDSSPSFPSGHTSFAFATATSLSLQYKKWYIVVPAYAWAAGVSYSRIHMGAHYPSDVLAGMIVGAGSAWVSYKLDQWIHRMWEKKTVENFLD